MRIPRIRFKVRWLMIAVAVVALILSVGAPLLRSQFRHVVIRVFNKSPTLVTGVKSMPMNGDAPLAVFDALREFAGVGETIAPGDFINLDFVSTGHTVVEISWMRPIQLSCA